MNEITTKSGYLARAKFGAGQRSFVTIEQVMRQGGE